MIISGHALFRFMERVHEVDFSALLAEYAALHGLPSGRCVVDHAHFMRWVDDTGALDLAPYVDEMSARVDRGDLNIVVKNDVVVTVLTPMPGFRQVDWGYSKAWAHRLSPRIRRIVLADIRENDEYDQRDLPIRRRSRRSTPET